MTALYNPVQQAFEKCIRDFKTELKDDELYNEILQTTSIDQVYDATDKLQGEQAKNGHMRHLSKIEPFLKGLSGYADAIDTFVQIKPDILALIWGPIKLLLQWTSILKQSFDAVVNTIGDIGDLLPEFKEVMRLFGHNEQINDVLALFFHDILDFYVITLKFFSLSRWKLIFEVMWPKQRDKIQVVISHIERHTLLMRNEVRLEHIREENVARLRALEHFEKTEKSHLRQEYNAIRESLSPRTYEEELYRFHSRTCEGTGRWLLKDAVFTEWLNESKKPIKPIWLQGIPGAGKSFLSSTVILEVSAHSRTLFAFLSYKFSNRISAISVIHSLLFQLTSDDDDLQTILCQSVVKNLNRDLEIAVALLTTLLTTAGPVFIIIDGFDEIDEIERVRLLKCLLGLSNSCEEVRILVSSRIEDDIHTILHDKVVEIRIDGRNAGSIQAFIGRQVQQWFLSRDFVSEAQSEIRGLLAPLSSKANGMFLYAKVVLSSIEHLDDMIAIRNELQVLPETLDDAYARILERIGSLSSPALRHKARKLLGWIGSSTTPLTLQEIEQALIIRMDDVDGDVRVIARLNPVRVCGPILEVVDNYVHFVHFTAKEYIFSPHIASYIDRSEAILSLASCCIQYLCQRHHDADLSDDELRDNVLSGAYRLHDYSATMWLELVERYSHLAKPITPPKELIDTLELLMEKRSIDEFKIDTGFQSVHTQSQHLFKPDHPHVHEMLRNAVYFQQKCSEGEYDKRNETSWIRLDPLTITRISIRLHRTFDQILLGCSEHHKKDCHCLTLQTHCGPRPFKCSFLSCHFGRYGFLTRAERDSHQRHHNRPWKCSRSDCPYSKGFLSRKMRDRHWEHCQQEGKKAIWLQHDPDEDEIQPLLFDLVRSNKVDLVSSLLFRLCKLDWTVQHELFATAASSGSTAMVDLFKLDGRIFSNSIERGIYAAIDAGNVETFRHLINDSSGKFGTFKYYWILSEILKSSSAEFRLGWEMHVDAECENERQSHKHPKHVPCGVGYTNGRLLRTARANADNEAFIILVWERINLVPEFPQPYLGATLGTVAATCFSLKMAKYLIDAGAPIDYRRSNKFSTPLHYAAKHNTPEAAEMMKFLLGLGADPEAYSVSSDRSGGITRRIRDEPGAKGISKWLGISWDDLVKNTRANNARIAT